MDRYSGELSRLVGISPQQLLAALGDERSRRAAMAGLAKGFPRDGEMAGVDVGAGEGGGRGVPETPDTPAPPAAVASPVAARRKRRKLAEPVRGCDM